MRIWTTIGAALALSASGASAHPHVWVKMHSRIEFAPDGKVEAVVHDWVFDEMYSAFATQGLAPKGQLVTREIFAPLAQENAGSLAEIGYYTTLKLDGKAQDFAPVKEFWMEERPDHLVAFHVRLDLKTPRPVGRFGSLLVADPEFYIDFEFDDAADAVVLDHAPSGCSHSLTRPKALEGDEKKKLDESFFTNLSPGAGFGFKMASRAILRVPLKLAALAAALAAMPAPALATAMRRPFAVGGGEGGGAYGGLTGWLLDAQSRLTHTLSLDLRAIPHDTTAVWALVGAGFVYGVAHAAGPGHGKAVIASYMMANDSALRRGLALALLAALLQGAVAVALVAVAALIFGATAARMNAVADGLAALSYLGVAAIGAWLCVRKGLALARAASAYFARRAAVADGMLFAGAPWRAASTLAGGGFRAGDAPEEGCGHVHAPDPRLLGEGFSWRAALATVAAAGARPCSGALLILVFALAQGLFAAGIAAVAAMSLGTALATGALAALAVYAKGLAVRAAAGEGARVVLVARLCEFLAALAVLAFGLALFFGARAGG